MVDFSNMLIEKKFKWKKSTLFFSLITKLLRNNKKYALSKVVGLTR